jgi:uncharacterized protein (DUF433 family)
MPFERITAKPNVLGGKPRIRGLRFPASRPLGLLASGETKQSIMKAYPYLEPQGIDDLCRMPKESTHDTQQGDALE